MDISGYVSEKCHLITDNKKSEELELSNSTASIVVKSVPIYVHPEGIQHQTTDSAYFCANGKIIHFCYIFVILLITELSTNNLYRTTHRVNDVRFSVSTYYSTEKSRRHCLRDPSKKERSHSVKSRT